MDVPGIINQLLVTTVAMGAMFGLGVVWGRRREHRRRIQDLRQNAHQKLSQAQAEVDVLDSVARPRSRAMRIVSTSRRAPQPGPEE